MRGCNCRMVWRWSSSLSKPLPGRRVRPASQGRCGMAFRYFPGATVGWFQHLNWLINCGTSPRAVFVEHQRAGGPVRRSARTPRRRTSLVRRRWGGVLGHMSPYGERIGPRIKHSSVSDRLRKSGGSDSEAAHILQSAGTCVLVGCCFADRFHSIRRFATHPPSLRQALSRRGHLAITAPTAVSSRSIA